MTSVNDKATATYNSLFALMGGFEKQIWRRRTREL